MAPTLDPASLDTGRRLARAGASVFLAGLLLGLVIPQFTVPRLGLSAHLLAILQGMFLLVVGLLWPWLRLPATVGRPLPWVALYGSIAPIVATTLAGIWGAGSTLLPMAAGGHQGTTAQETVVMVLLRSAGVSLIVTSVALIWGLKPAGR